MTFRKMFGHLELVIEQKHPGLDDEFYHYKVGLYFCRYLPIGPTSEDMFVDSALSELDAAKCAAHVIASILVKVLDEEWLDGVEEFLCREALPHLQAWTANPGAN